jgi:hypothetical protein
MRLAEALTTGFPGSSFDRICYIILPFLSVVWEPHRLAAHNIAQPAVANYREAMREAEI